MVGAGSKEVLFSISANFSAVEVSVWAITGAGLWAGIADVVSVISAGGCGFGARIADVFSVISAGAKFNEFSGGFSGVDAVVSGRLRLVVSWGRFASRSAVETVLSTCDRSICFNSDVSGVLT